MGGGFVGWGLFWLRGCGMGGRRGDTIDDENDGGSTALSAARCGVSMPGDIEIETYAKRCHLMVHMMSYEPLEWVCKGIYCSGLRR